MVGWPHPLNGDEFKQAPGGGEGQGSLVFCSTWGHKESSVTEQLNNKAQRQVQRAEHVHAKKKKKISDNS